MSNRPGFTRLSLISSDASKESHAPFIFRYVLPKQTVIRSVIRNTHRMFDSFCSWNISHPRSLPIRNELSNDDGSADVLKSFRLALFYLDRVKIQKDQLKRTDKLECCSVRTWKALLYLVQASEIFSPRQMITLLSEIAVIFCCHVIARNVEIASFTTFSPMLLNSTYVFGKCRDSPEYRKKNIMLSTRAIRFGGAIR